MIRKAISVFLLGIAALGFASSAALAEAAKPGVVLQVSDDNPKTWGQALNVVKNIQNAYGKDKVDIEVVAFGLGAGMLKLDSPLANRIDETLATGAQRLHVREHDEGAEADQGRHASEDRLRARRRDRDHREAEAGLDRHPSVKPAPRFAGYSRYSTISCGVSTPMYSLIARR